VAKLLVGVLDVVQEFRQLSMQELLLKRDLKGRIMGLSAVEKLTAKQQSRLTAIKAENAMQTEKLHPEDTHCHRNCV